jgi:hypothetical protein
LPFKSRVLTWRLSKISLASRSKPSGPSPQNCKVSSVTHSPYLGGGRGVEARDWVENTRFVNDSRGVIEGEKQQEI